MKTFLPAKHLWAAVCAVSAMVPLCASTGLAQDLKVGFVDMHKFATKSVKAQAMQKKLLDLMNTKGTALENKRQEIAALEKRFQKVDPMLEKETRYQLVEEIRIKEMDISKLVELESRTRAWDPPRTERIPPEDLVKSAFSRNVLDTGWSLQCDIVKIIARIRSQKGLVMVFDKTGVLSADDALDITDEVAEAYDAEPAKSGAPAAAPAP
jgi:Skp family chaperone for outer membrane proteins